ncbi:MAG TPA: arginase family protein [Candidatus Macondimonas sp.]|nr:arginase family protein [Candidatus Macondimonas sp.]
MAIGNAALGPADPRDWRGSQRSGHPPGTRRCGPRFRPQSSGFLPREILYLLGAVAKEGICGMEVVEVSPPYDQSEITALLATRAIVDVLGTLVAYGKLGSHRSIIRGWGA